MKWKTYFDEERIKRGYQYYQEGKVYNTIITPNTITTKVEGSHSHTYEVKITLIDKERKELVTIAGYIDKVEAGDTVELNTSVTVDVANAYDFKISK